MRTPIVNLRVKEDRKARWQAAADAAGKTLSAFIADAADAACGKDTPAQDAPSGKDTASSGKDPAGKPRRRRPAARAPQRQPSRERTEPCVHRVAVDGHCSRGCDD